MPSKYVNVLWRSGDTSKSSTSNTPCFRTSCAFPCGLGCSKDTCSSSKLPAMVSDAMKRLVIGLIAKMTQSSAAKNVCAVWAICCRVLVKSPGSPAVRSSTSNNSLILCNDRDFILHLQIHSALRRETSLTTNCQLPISSSCSGIISFIYDIDDECEIR